MQRLVSIRSLHPPFQPPRPSAISVYAALPIIWPHGAKLLASVTRTPTRVRGLWLSRPRPHQADMRVPICSIDTAVCTQDVILEPLEDDCRLLQSLLDGVLKIEIGPDLLQKACCYSLATERSFLRNVTAVSASHARLADRSATRGAIKACPKAWLPAQVMHIRSLAECSSNLAACGDAVRASCDDSAFAYTINVPVGPGLWTRDWQAVHLLLLHLLGGRSPLPAATRGVSTTRQ